LSPSIVDALVSETKLIADANIMPANHKRTFDVIEYLLKSAALKRSIKTSLAVSRSGRFQVRETASEGFSIL